MDVFKVACIENSAGSYIEENLKLVGDLVEEAVLTSNATLVCLAEYYCVLKSSDEEYLDDSFRFEGHPALLHSKKLAKKFNIWMLLGSIPVYQGKKKIKNRSVVVDPRGDIAGYYDKIHLFDVAIKDGQDYRESSFVSAGNEAKIITLPWGRLGLTVCYDVRFPHLYRVLARSGAEFLSIPAAFTQKTGEAHWHTLVRARAIETGSYVFAPAQCGVRSWGRKTYGHSLIVDPWGNILAEGAGEEGFITAEIDTKKVLKCRSMIPSVSHNKIITKPKDFF